MHWSWVEGAYMEKNRLAFKDGIFRLKIQQGCFHRLFERMHGYMENARYSQLKMGLRAVGMGRNDPLIRTDGQLSQCVRRMIDNR
jgi:hypothetical protein